jgi:hypothetical protein
MIIAYNVKALAKAGIVIRLLGLMLIKDKMFIPFPRSLRLSI